MKISLFLSVYLLALVIKIVTANVIQHRSPQQYCGSKLADMMKALCKGRYNEKSKRSRIDSELMDYKDADDYYNGVDYSYRPRQESMSFMPSRFLRSSKPRIIDECCYKPCYITELQGYCAN